MNEISTQRVVRMALIFLGLFGVGLAISGLLIALPAPAAGGTCGPGRTSEAAIVALVDPVSIGAGTEPSATDAADATERANWIAFVSECQTSADNRGLAAIAILAVSAVVALVVPMLIFRRRRRSSDFVLPSPADPHWRY